MTGFTVVEGAMLLFAPYLLYAIRQSKGDFTVHLMGKQRCES